MNDATRILHVIEHGDASAAELKALYAAKEPPLKKALSK
jgi:hypothetical protein